MKIALAVSLVLALALPVTADHCETYSSSSPEVTIPGGDGATYYVDNDLCQICGFWTFWVYQESNGIDGLQRGDEIVDDTCHRSIRADTIIF